VIKRLAATLGIVVFFVLAGTAAGYAYWSASAEITTATTLGDPAAANCVKPVKLTNGGFESPDIGTNGILNQASIPGWKLDAKSSNPIFELWTGHDGVGPAVGDQFLELNGNGPDIAYQELEVAPGQVLHWSLLHHGRWGNDTMYVAIDPVGASSYTYQVPTGATSTAITTGTAGWVRYSGTYVVPATQPANVKTRFALVPGTTTSTRPGETVTNGSVGNLVDDISFGSGPCLDANSTITNLNASKSGLEPGDTAVVATTISNLGTRAASGVVLTLPISSALGTLSNIQIDGVSAGARATLAGSTLTVRLGSGANGTAGGTVDSSASIVVSYRAPVIGALGGVVSTTPQLTYGDSLYPGWSLTRTGETVTATIADATPPPKPTNVVVTVSGTVASTGATSTTITWTAPSSTSDVASYVVQRVSSTGTWADVGTAALGTTSFTDVTATAGQAYAYRVLAVDAASNRSVLTVDDVKTVITAFGTLTYRAAWMNGTTPVCIENDNGYLQNASSCGTASSQRWKISGTGTSIVVTPSTGTNRWLQKRTCLFGNYICSWSTNVTVQGVGNGDYSTWTFDPHYDPVQELAFVWIKNSGSKAYLGASSASADTTLQVGSTTRDFFFTQQ